MDFTNTKSVFHEILYGVDPFFCITYICLGSYLYNVNRYRAAYILLRCKKQKEDKKRHSENPPNDGYTESGYIR